jgi:phosphatidate cytidylyltransferase
MVLIAFVVSLSLLNNQESSVEKLLSQVASIGILFLYPSLPFVYATRLTFLPDSLGYLLLLAFLVFTNDSFAYLFGRLFGKWIPGSLKVSPNKTIVGFLGGILGTVISLVGAWFFGLLSLPLWGVILMGIPLGIAVIWGDLLESAFKRRAGVKDSGTLIRGRGGILDSADSFFFVAPVYYYFVLWFF